MTQLLNDFKDIGILVKRALGLSDYGLPEWGGEMTSRELEDFNSRFWPGEAVLR